MKCSKCRKNKPLSEFNKGRHSCRDCDREVARDHARRRRERLWEERKPIIDRYLGTKCVICSETRHNLLRCHEIFGNDHKPLLETPLDEVEENCRSGRFVRVCEKCHRKAHSLMKKGIIGWAEIVSLIKEFLATNPPFIEKKHQQQWRKWRKKRLGRPRQPALAL